MPAPFPQSHERYWPRSLHRQYRGPSGNAQKRIQLRQTAFFYKADPDYGRRMAEELNLDVKKIEALAKMSPEERENATR
jgi:catalase